MKRKIVPIAVASLVLGFLFDYFFFDKTLGVSVLLYSILILLSTVYLGELFRNRLQRSVYWLMPAVLFFAFMVSVRASGMLLFFNMLLILYLLLLIAKLATQPQTSLARYSVWQYFAGLPLLPFQFLRETGVEARRVLSDPGARVDKGVLRPVLRGLFIAVPILVLFIILLSSADLVFQKYVTSIFDFHINAELFWRTVLVLYIASLFVGAFVALYMRKSRDTDAEKQSVSTVLGPIEATIVLGSVEALFLIFLIIQATYFFGGNHHVLTSSFTYAAYARRGFFELIAVAAVSLVLVWVMKQSVQLKAGRQERTFLWLSLALMAEVLVIMLSAHMRLGLYEQTYGFTELRLLAHMFIYWLALAFILAAIYMVRREAEHQFAFRLFLSALLFFFILNIINPDALIARHNIDRFKKTGKIDTTTLVGLSPDATPVLVTLLGSNVKVPFTGTTVGQIISYDLQRQQQELDCIDDHWQSANLSRAHAKALLQQRPEVTAQTSNLATACPHD